MSPAQLYAHAQIVLEAVRSSLTSRADPWFSSLRYVMMRVCLLLSSLSDAEYRERVGDSYQWEGRVEIYLSGSWGTIADSDWTEEDAAVTCHTLGHILTGPTSPNSSPNIYEGIGIHMIIHYNCTIGSFLLHSFLLICHPYPLHFMK